MTNDAERVSDIVARLRTEAGIIDDAYSASDEVGDGHFQRLLVEAATSIDSYRDAATEQSRIMADIEEKNEALQAQIEAQSKALAEAREECALTAERLGRSFAEDDHFAQASGCNTVAEVLRLTPTPENPNG